MKLGLKKIVALFLLGIPIGYVGCAKKSQQADDLVVHSEYKSQIPGYDVFKTEEIYTINGKKRTKLHIALSAQDSTMKPVFIQGEGIFYRSDKANFNYLTILLQPNTTPWEVNLETMTKEALSNIIYGEFPTERDIDRARRLFNDGRKALANTRLVEVKEKYESQ